MTKYKLSDDSSPKYRKHDPERLVLNVDRKDGLGESCLCGCGESAKSRFAQGHDQRLRGKLTRAHVAGVEVLFLVNGQPNGKPESALKAAARFGMDHHLEAKSAKLAGKAKP